MSSKFVNNPYVLGYDPMNEPAPADSNLLIPGHMDREYLAPMYEKVFEKYQAHDSTK